VRARLAFQPLCEGDSGSLDRLAPGPRPVVCLVGMFVSPARCSQADAARAALPPYAARAAQPSTLPLRRLLHQRGSPQVLHSHRGQYHTDRHPGAALQNTAICPAGPARSRAAKAGGQSHSTQDTVIRPGPHSCPFWHRSG
jgi:hypothetical protein